MKKTIQKIFDNVHYWQEKDKLLKAIPEYLYSSEDLILNLLNVKPGFLGKDYDAKRDMWNHMIISQKMGDDILNNTSSDVLDSLEFAKQAVIKYNRTYIYLSEKLQNHIYIVKSTIANEPSPEPEKYLAPILMYMPEEYQNNIDLSLIACSKNFHNIKYAPKLQRNKYFIIDIMNITKSNKDKKIILSYIDQELLEDKAFVGKLGCFDNVCDKFKGDLIYVTNAVTNDINILKKTDLFDEAILEAVIYSDYYHENIDESIEIVFNYIKQFNNDVSELNSKIEDKTILNKLLWDMGEILS
jgi:hypothetical protein